MPNIKSAKKRTVVIEKKTLRNKMIKSDLRTAVKKADTAIAENTDNKNEAVKTAIKKIDMACSKGILHKNTAANKKSKLMKRLAQSNG